MDTKMHEKDFLPGQKLPIEILPVHDAWAEMQKKMDDEKGAVIGMPEPAVSKQKSFLQNRISRISLLLLLLLLTIFFAHQANKKTGDQYPITTEQKHDGSNDPLLNKKANDAKEPGDTKIKGPSPEKQETADAEKTEIKNENGTNGPAIRKNKDLVADKRVAGLTSKKKSSSTNQNTGSKKQKTKKIESGNQDKQSILKNDREDNTSTDVQVIVQDPTMQKKSTADSIAATKNKNEPKKDSVVNAMPSPDDDVPSYKPHVAAGLHWNFQVPVDGAGNYFKGADATSRPYTVLLPGIWVSVKQDHHLLRAGLNPFYSNLLPAKSFGSFTAYANLPDTIVITTETKTLRKTFGINLAADYNYSISGNWWAGGGIYANWIRKGITSANGLEERRSLSNGGVITRNVNRRYTTTKGEWDNFALFQIGIHAEVNYITSKMQTGLRIGLPVTPIAKHKGQQNSVRTEIIFRLPLYLSGGKAKNPFTSN